MCCTNHAAVLTQIRNTLGSNQVLFLIFKIILYNCICRSADFQFYRHLSY